MKKSKSINIWDIILSVTTIDTTMKDVDFAVINHNGIKVINNYHNDNMLYKFNVADGSIKEVRFNAFMKYVDVKKMWQAFCSLWYQFVLADLLEILLPFSTVNHDAMVAYVENCNRTILFNDIESKYNILKSRLATLREICLSFSPTYDHDNTLTYIVSELYYGYFDGMDEMKDEIKNAITAINKQVDKENTSINLKGLKEALTSFTSTFWQESEKDGILPYHYNCNSTMAFNVLCASRKRNISKEGVITYDVVTFDSIVKETVFNMVARLQAMKEDEVNIANKEEEEKKKDKNK